MLFIKFALQSPEEIAKLTIDESLSDIDRAQLLITTGQEVQQICAINQLPRLLEKYNVDTMCRVVPQLMVSIILYPIGRPVTTICLTIFKCFSKFTAIN